jgi:hypothetical protein
MNFPGTAVAASLLAIGLSACGDQSALARDEPKIIALDDAATALRDTFNRDRGNVRLLFIVDPACPGCLRGVADIDRDLLSQVPADSKLKVYVVHLSVIGGTERDTPNVTGLMHTPHALHFWNGSGSFGNQVTQALDLRMGKDLVYAWDVWMAYPPDAAWPDASVPKPHIFMHQLRGLMDNPKFPFLDSKAFATGVQGLLKQAGAPP